MNRRQRERKEGDRGVVPGRGNGPAGGAGGVRSWSSGPCSRLGELRLWGRVSLLKSPADQGYAANKDRLCPSRLFSFRRYRWLSVLSVPPVPMGVGTHGREGGTQFNIALGILHRRRALS